MLVSLSIFFFFFLGGGGGWHHNTHEFKHSCEVYTELLCQHGAQFCVGLSHSEPFGFYGNKSVVITVLKITSVKLSLILLSALVVSKLPSD